MSATGHQRRRRMAAAERAINSGVDLAAFVREHELECEPDPESVYEEVSRRADFAELAESAEAGVTESEPEDEPDTEPSDGPDLQSMKAAEVRAYAEEILGYDPGTKKAAIAALEADDG